MDLLVLILLNSDFLLGQHEGENRVIDPEEVVSLLWMRKIAHVSRDHREVPRGPYR